MKLFITFLVWLVQAAMALLLAVCAVKGLRVVFPSLGDYSSVAAFFGLFLGIRLQLKVNGWYVIPGFLEKQD